MNSLWNAGIMAHETGFALGEGNEEEGLFQEDDEDDFLAEIMQNAGGDILDFEFHDSDKPSIEWAPYPSKMVFLWILKESGVQDVPSFDHLRKVQTKIRERCGIPTTQYKSAKGNIFHMNDPRTLVAKDWANPETRKFIYVYPEIPEDGVIREIWHAQKWRKDMDLDLLSPMYDAKHLQAHFYVNKLAHLKSGEFVIPIRWLKFRNHICADAFVVEIDSSGIATVIDGHTILISSVDLTANYLDLEDEHCIPKWSEGTFKSGHPDRMPNPKRALAGGDPLYSSFIDYFGDDVSGNRSKSWNKHWNAYMTHHNLPRVLLQQEFHVHFVSTSPHASITEQFTEIITRQTHKEPVRVRDAETQETTRFCIHANAGPSDNPMQSEISGHIGAKGNFFCRKCEAGRSEKDKETNECFHSLFSPGMPRSKEKILTELQKQAKLACAGVAQPIKNTQKDTGIKDAYTQHWIDHLLEQFKQKKQEMPGRSSTDIQEELIHWTLDNDDKIYSGFLTLKGFDPTKDTPVEILHTILLGVVKYIWHSSHTSWTPAQKQTYSLHLQSTNTNGLSIHAIRANYIMQYANSLIGRQFKTIAQVNIFHVHGIVSDERQGDVRIAVGNVMDAFAIVDPTKILSNIKLHLLPHSEEDIVAFGPLVGVATEIFECFNAVFRFCSILSNHLAPSRDIALQLADQEGLKHRLTGGWWPTPEGDWERAGPGVRAFLETRPVLQRLVGWSIHNPPIPGSVKLIPLPKRQKGVPKPTRPAVMMSSTHALQALNTGNYDMASPWFACRQVIAASLDECINGSWVFAKSPITGKLVAGRIDNILEDGKGSAVIILDDIRFLYNTQHDCEEAGCEATGERPHMQERVDTGLTDKVIVHKPVERFIINTHAYLLRQALPRGLIAPIPLFVDRKAKHYELAVNLREIKNGKRKRAADKRTAKKKPVDSNLNPNTVDSYLEPEDSVDDTEDEGRPRNKQHRRKNQVDESGDSDFEYGGSGRAEPVQIGAPRTSGRVCRPTARAQAVDCDSD
ncbi:hypothetical protein B0H10DRAFT_1950204 [Mycena sp. CBHHK59/15]|nr:hypothetical protein B0H10DRAFT_1950204 [Mycena sp. CBHHK59/15]